MGTYVYVVRYAYFGKEARITRTKGTFTLYDSLPLAYSDVFDPGIHPALPAIRPRLP